jgi:serine protease Do
MTNQNPSTSTSPRELKRSLLSARKLALMASVVTGLCIAGNGFGTSSGNSFFGTAALAEASNATTVAQPSGFADLVDRVKPSVISVKVTLKEKVVDADSKTDEGSDSPMERFFRRFGGPEGMPQNPGREGRHGEMGPGIRFLYLVRRLLRSPTNTSSMAPTVVKVTAEAGRFSRRSDRHGSAHGHRLIKVDGGSTSVCKAVRSCKARIGDWVLRSAARLVRGTAIGRIIRQRSRYRKRSL